MKHTKRLLTWILVVLAVVSACVLAACVEKPSVPALPVELPVLAQEVAVVIKDGDNYSYHVVALNENLQNAADVLQNLHLSGKITVEISDGEYGKSLNKLNNLVLDNNAHTYVACYTSVFGAGGGADVAYTVGGTKLYYSNYGIGEMAVSAGTVLYFEGGTW